MESLHSKAKHERGFLIDFVLILNLGQNRAQMYEKTRARAKKCFIYCKLVCSNLVAAIPIMVNCAVLGLTLDANNFWQNKATAKIHSSE